MERNECYQHIKKIEYKNHDLELYGLNENESISIKDLKFEIINKDDKDRIDEVKKFIERYEWVGKVNNYWNHTFALTYKAKLVTVIMVGTPAMFSKLLGENTKSLEQTLHRGASCYIAPKNSGSYLISKSLKWMVKNTPYRIFSGYSTMHEANEFGYIYQSLNAILISKNAGTRLEYLKPGTISKWLSDRNLRKLSNYKKIAKELDIQWQKNWNDDWKINWDKIPLGEKELIRQSLKDDYENLTFRKVPPKLKYIIIKGKNKRETKHLINELKAHNPRLVNKDGSIGLPYPKKDKLCKNVAIQ